MTPEMSPRSDNNLQAELVRLAYSAYLLTLDPALALSVVMTAIDGSLEETTTDRDLLERTVELSLQQLRRESSIDWDGESSPFDAALYGYSETISSQAFQPLKDLSGNPILLLDSNSRIAFVLHHVLGYNLREAAVMAQIEEKEYRTQLREAYLQLASFHADGQITLDGNVFEECALA
jgi:hypothetical protein